MSPSPNPSPLVIPAPSPSSTAPATVIFLHGFGDDAHGWTDLVSQFHRAGKLSHVKWILPNAPENRDAMAQAWYTPKSFSVIPLPKREGEPDPDEDEEEDDEEGMMASVEYICGLIDQEHREGGVPLERIVLGGFSQGCAIALLVGLMSWYRGRLGGVVGLSGYLPLGRKVKEAVEERGQRMAGETRYFFAHGSSDQLVPKRVFLAFKDRIQGWEGEKVESHLYEGMGHTTSGAEIRDLCAWLEQTISSE